MDVHWNNILTKPLGESRINVKIEEIDISPKIPESLTNAKATSKKMNHEDKVTIFNILNKIGFYDMIHTKV